MKYFIQFSKWLAANASLFIIAIAIVTFFVPDLFVWVRGTTQTVILGIIMLTMGLTLTTDDFRILARRPLDILIGACAQFFIMPCVAYLLVHVFRLEPALALGILLVGCCPGGVSSNIMSYLCHGDVAFSVGMTCASTLLAPVMTPMLMELTAGQIIEIDAVGMFLNILIVTIIPVGIGCFLNYTYSKNKHFPTIQSLMPGLSVTCLACIVGGVISTVHDDLIARGLMLFLWTFAVVFCHNTLGYILGYTAGRIAGFNTAKKRTISIEVGMQNAGLATVLAGNFFASQPLAVLPCAISCAWHSISGTILAGLFLRMKKSLYIIIGIVAILYSCGDGKSVRHHPSKGEKTIWVLSDIHVMAPELFQGTDKAEEVRRSSKLLQYSAEILDRVVASALSTKPDLVLIAGDLTEKGDLLSHKHVVSQLSKLSSAGIKVAVIPGNHDIDNTADSTSSQQFVKLYQGLGYNMSYARDEASLSYACEPFDGLVLLCIDTASGSINASTLTWLLDKADKARAKGKQVVALQHHNIAEHYDRQRRMQRRYILKKHKKVSQQMMQHGIHMIFTGHTHVNDISQYRTDADSLVDVETGSLSAYPNAWRKIKVNEDFTKWDFSVAYVKKTPSIADVQKLSYQHCLNSLPSIVKSNADVLWPALDRKRSILTNIQVDGSVIPTTLDEFREWFSKGMGDKMCQALMMHIEGNEGQNPKSAALLSDIRETLIDMFKKRFADKKVPADKATMLQLFVSAYYNKSFRIQMESMLTDTNQLSDDNLSSITDDLNATLYLAK